MGVRVIDIMQKDVKRIVFALFLAATLTTLWACRGATDDNTQYTSDIESGYNENDRDNAVLTTADEWDREWEIDDGPMGDGEVILVWFADSLIEGSFESKENWWFNKRRSLDEALTNALNPEKLAEIRDEIFAAVGEFERYGNVTLISPLEDIDKGRIHSVTTRHARGNTIFTFYIDSDGKFYDFSFEFEMLS